MKKKIGMFLFTLIIWGLASFVIHKVLGNPEWITTTVIGAVACSFGFFTGQQAGKNEDD